MNKSDDERTMSVHVLVTCLVVFAFFASLEDSVLPCLETLAHHQQAISLSPGIRAIFPAQTLRHGATISSLAVERRAAQPAPRWICTVAPHEPAAVLGNDPAPPPGRSPPIA